MLDPHRIGLNAESIGFQKRMHQDLDWAAVNKALQTDYNNQNSAVQVRREQEAPKNEIRVMGGQLSGFESNELLLTRQRQERQINGYPLRHFDSDNPAVILPKKYGGFPLYNRNQTEYPELVSVFTEPMSAPLQRDTELLGRAGAVAMSNDIQTPYSPLGFIHPMNAPMDRLQQNANVFRQRRHLQRMSEISRIRQMGTRSQGSGIFVDKNGVPTSLGQEEINNNVAKMNAFGGAMNEYNQRMNRLIHRENMEGGVAGMLMANPGPEGLGELPDYQNNAASRSITSRADERFTTSVEEDIDLGYIDKSLQPPQNVMNATPFTNYTPSGNIFNNGLQEGQLETPSKGPDIYGTPPTPRELFPGKSAKNNKKLYKKITQGTPDPSLSSLKNVKLQNLVSAREKRIRKIKKIYSPPP